MASQKRQRLQALQALHPCLQPGVAGLRPSIGEMLAARVELFRSFSYFWQPTCISPPFRYFRHSQAPKPRAFWWTLCQAQGLEGRKQEIIHAPQMPSIHSQAFCCAVVFLTYCTSTHLLILTHSHHHQGPKKSKPKLTYSSNSRCGLKRQIESPCSLTPPHLHYVCAWPLSGGMCHVQQCSAAPVQAQVAILLSGHSR
ncbi:hypothetical protein V8C43DRAFT_45239 [Trichoderma afarasin]